MAVRRASSLVESLVAGDSEPPYLQGARGRLRLRPRGGTLEALRFEIYGEMAAALGRSAERLSRALQQLDAIRGELEALKRESGAGAPVSERATERVAAFNRQRKVAQRWRWELEVHREALGLRSHEVLDRLYPLPPAWRPGWQRRGSGGSNDAGV